MGVFRILLLNDDVLDLIIAGLVSESKRSAFPFSQACRRIRSRCLPIFFKECTIAVYAPLKAETFLPPTLWEYVWYFYLHLIVKVQVVAEHL